MPGGHPEAWPHIKPIFQSIAAKADGEPCCDWVSAGHRVLLQVYVCECVCVCVHVCVYGVHVCVWFVCVVCMCVCGVCVCVCVVCVSITCYYLTFIQVGEDGAGHYVKMVHNGIEYGDMQVWRHAGMEICGYGDMRMWRSGYRYLLGMGMCGYACVCVKRVGVV